VVIEHLIQL